MWYQLFKYLLFCPVVSVFLRPRLEGEDNIPTHGAAIVASNHLDATDTFSLPAKMHRRLTFAAKVELFKGTTFRTRVVAWFLKAVGQVPMDRSGGRATASALDPINQVLHDGGLVGIFPEGTRSVDGRLYRGHTGVARLALATGAPVIPVGMINTRVRPGLLGLPTMSHARIVVGKPLDYSAWMGREGDARVLRWVTDDVMAHIQQLSGQSYVDVYCSRVKTGNLKGADLTAYLKSTPTTGEEMPEEMPA